MEQTKEVIGFFGKPKQITREAFVKIWRGQAIAFDDISLNSADYDLVKKITTQVEEMAGRKWDAI